MIIISIVDRNLAYCWVFIICWTLVFLTSYITNSINIVYACHIKYKLSFMFLILELCIVIAKRIRSLLNLKFLRVWLDTSI